MLSPKEVEQEWKRLEKVHGKDKLKKARELAALLDRPNSRETAGGFLVSFTDFGIEATEQAAREVANLSRDNPYRHVGTVIYRLKKETEGTE